jgi:hypothetical protein
VLKTRIWQIFLRSVKIDLGDVNYRTTTSEKSFREVMKESEKAVQLLKIIHTQSEIEFMKENFDGTC